MSTFGNLVPGGVEARALFREKVSTKEKKRKKAFSSDFFAQFDFELRGNTKNAPFRVFDVAVVVVVAVIIVVAVVQAIVVVIVPDDSNSDKVSGQNVVDINNVAVASVVVVVAAKVVNCSHTPFFAFSKCLFAPLSVSL